MPQATQRTWLKTLGRLPWWRQSAYAKANGNGSAKVYEFDEAKHPREPAGSEGGGKFAPSGGGAAGAASSKSGASGTASSLKQALKQQLAGVKEKAQRFKIVKAAVSKALDQEQTVLVEEDTGRGDWISTGLTTNRLLGLLRPYQEEGKGVVEHLALHDLIGTQRAVDRRELRRMLHKALPEEPIDSAPLEVGRMPDGRLVLFDGHHRATLYRLLGVGMVKAKVSPILSEAIARKSKELGVTFTRGAASLLYETLPLRVGRDTTVPDRLVREPTQYEKKVDFAAIDRELTALTKQGRERVRAVLAGARDRLLALVGRKHKDGALTTTFVNGLELRGTGQLVPTLREVLRAAFAHGQRQADAELYRGRLGLAAARGLSRTDTATMVAGFHQQHPNWPKERLITETKMAVACGNSKTYQVKLVPEGLPPTKALEFFEQKATLWGADIKQPLLGQVKNTLYNGIKTGEGLRTLLDELTAVFLPWLGDEDQQVDEKTLSPYRLETMVRTNIGEAMNEGRKAQFQPEVDSGFIIGYAYSAVLDERTTPVCNFLDGMILPPDSPETDQLSPPRHWSCRSLLSPVLRTEGPVEYITPQEVAEGLALSGTGFADGRAARTYREAG